VANKFVLLAGLPRTGSTLLANILAQNGRFHIEGNSGLCQLMWDMQESCNKNCAEQLNANKKLETVRSSIVGELPNLYYKDVKNKVIFDKCRPWVIPANMKMAKTFISKDIKAIVLVRPIDEIVKSFAKMHFAAGRDASIYSELLDDKSEVLMRSFIGVYLAAKSKEKNCLFVSYNNIVEDTAKVLSAIYNFINEEKFIHNVNKIEQVVKEDESPYVLDGIHSIREKISKLENDLVLPKWVEKKCSLMTKALFTEFRGIKNGSLCQAR
jgi:sulfotransferase